MLAQALSKEGINVSYTTDRRDLNIDNLNRYDALIIYANHETDNTEQVAALSEYVQSGHGFIPIHCASFCFNTSHEYINMVGGQFERHDTGVVAAEIVLPNHPAMNGVKSFASWDETYVHQKLADDITVLMERVEGHYREPWTWVKEYGQGKVFYTAYGHNEKTWSHPEFQNLIKSGILWAVSPEVKELYEAFMADMPELQYREVSGIPNYEKRQPPPLFQEPLSPDESKRLTQVPPGFELQLFVSEPDIINPITMDWDEKGRLWVIETVDYPNTVRNDKGQGDDRIKICEDTDGDGRADKFTVFAEGLNIPTSLVFANGGIIVAQAPDFLFLKDTDGDDIADIRQVLFSGWGTFDTHAGPSNLTYGLDNQIWGTVGYSGFDGVIAGDSMKFRQGLYRFPTDLSSFEYVTSTSNNTWGLGFTENNEVFASTANNNHSVYMGIPNKYYNNSPELPIQGSKKIDGHYAMHSVTNKVRQVDVFGGFTAAAGHSFYNARTYPEEYWDRMALVCEPTGNLVHIAKIKPDGGGFKEVDGWNLLASTDEWFSPVEAKVGPDGNVWIADWYNFIIQHNPTPSPERGGFQAENGEGNAYIQPLRDKSHGRIWRLVQKKGENGQKYSLDKANEEFLVDALGHDNMFWRKTAQRIIVESQNMDFKPLLFDIVHSGLENVSINHFQLLHSLWALDGLIAFDGISLENLEKIHSLLQHSSSAIRKAVIDILSATVEGQAILMKERIWEEADSNVLLSALLALSICSENQDVGMGLYALTVEGNITEDYWLSQALYIAAAKHSRGFIKSYIDEYGQYIPPTINTDELSWLEGFMQNQWREEYVNLNSQETTTSSNQLVIQLGVIQNEMKYDKKEFVVKAGQSVRIEFENRDFMQHNLVIGRPGSLEEIGRAADKMAMDTDAAERNYVPDLPSILHATALVNPEDQVVLEFTAPAEEGFYPFICTFPGHWQIMNGIMKVVKQ
ncbi:hypothetical protein GCM10025777_21190 [Membranihabitans marinus]